MKKLKAQSSKLKEKDQSLKICALGLSLAFCALSFMLIASRVFAEPTSSIELISKAKEFDGKTVIYQGEVIGDVMKRGNYAWANINDGKKAIGIWVNYSLAKSITYSGSYKFKGDIVEISGIFHRACPEHGGDLDIHAQDLRIIKTGSPRQERPERKKINAAIVALGATGLIWTLSRLKFKSKRKSKT